MDSPGDISTGSKRFTTIYPASSVGSMNRAIGDAANLLI
jgi:hypothetical protein